MNAIDKKKYIHTAIGLVLMFGIGLLPPIEPVTQAGMQVGGVFIGLLYLWTILSRLPCGRKIGDAP